MSLLLNGIDGTTGDYIVPPLTFAQVATHAHTARLNRDDVRYHDIERLVAPQFRYTCSCETIDRRNLARAGWGILFARDCDVFVYDALRPLCDYRRAHVGSDALYHEWYGDTGYQPGETYDAFLQRNAINTMLMPPSSGMPSYILIVGDMATIPYVFQQALQIHHAVGRIACEHPAEYAAYAASVVAAEQHDCVLSRHAVLVGTPFANDPVSRNTNELVLEPLAQHLHEQLPTWHITHHNGDNTATQSDLHALFHTAPVPALVYAAGHSVAFSADHANQRVLQGRLLCHHWDGVGQPLTALHWLDVPLSTHHDVDATTANALPCFCGNITFLDASFSAATLESDAATQLLAPKQTAIASQPFLARLPQQLLTYPLGGALAVVGNVNRVWSSAYPWQLRRAMTDVIAHVVTQVLQGYPVGAAMHAVRMAYAERMLALTTELEKVAMGKPTDPADIVGMWAVCHDLSAMMILGDPAARLPDAALHNRE